MSVVFFKMSRNKNEGNIEKYPQYKKLLKEIILTRIAIEKFV